MNRSRWLVLFASLTLLAAVPTRADDVPASQPSTQPAGDAIDVSDLDAIKAAAGTEISVKGKIYGTYKPESGSVLLFNFDQQRNFNGVVKKANIEAVNAGFDGDVAAAVKGKMVTITGMVSMYKDKPQIEIVKPDQIKIQDE